MEVKKGIQLSQAFGAVLAIVLVAVLVIIAIFLFDTLGQNFATTDFSVTNENPASIISTGYQLDAPSACQASSFVVTQASNISNGTRPHQAITVAGNISVDSIGLITNASAIEWDGNVSLNYTYVAGEGACNATDTMITQFATFPALVGLLGTIVFLGLVIGVLVGSFVFGGRRRV